MIARLVVRSLRRGRARFVCGAAGMAVAVGAMVFTTSLVATNNAQAPLLAARAARPWAAWKVEEGEKSRVKSEEGFAINRLTDSRLNGVNETLGECLNAIENRKSKIENANSSLFTLHSSLRMSTLALTCDHRPNGRVLQGPPMRALMAEAPQENPYGAVALTEGRWVNAAAAEPEVVCVKKAMRRFGAAAPALGESLKFVGRKGTMTARVVGYLDGDTRLPSQFPTVFANPAAFNALAAEEHGTIAFYKAAPANASSYYTPASESVVNAFRSDEQRRMDYAKPLMLVAAVLTALALLVNSLLLSVEANRRELAILRTVGLTRRGVVGAVLLEALLMGACGWVIGTAGGALVLWGFVGASGASFPAGAAFDVRTMGATLVVLPALILVATLFALRPALRVRPMDALNAAPRPRRHGMAVTFALGFAAFVAVEVWGASLMRAFVPSPEWPDAIVSLLPGGASSFDIEKLRGIEGVKRISELLPLQVWLDAGEEGKKTAFKSKRPNVLFLAAEWLPAFKFVEGDWASAEQGLRDGGVVIAEMVSRALNLHKGDCLILDLGLFDSATRPVRRSQQIQPVKQSNNQTISLPIVGVVDVNWHMVTSRGLVRGLNRMPVMTDGPVFAPFDTVESLDPRPAPMVRMTHLWVEYEPDFLAAHGVFPTGRLIEAEIARRLGNPVEATVRLHARDEIADGTLAHGSSVIGAAARVPFVFLAILSIGFVAMLVAEADARRRELATLRAVGATRRQLTLRLAASAARTALVGMAFGLPLGALAGWLTSFKTAAIWPGMPHYFVVPWRIVLEGGLGALCFALVFALPAALSLVGRLTRRR